MLVSSQRRRNQVFVGSWAILIIGAFFAYFDIFSPDIKKAFGYVWIVGVLVQLIFGLYWTIGKYNNNEFEFQRKQRHNIIRNRAYSSSSISELVSYRFKVYGVFLLTILMDMFFLFLWLSAQFLASKSISYLKSYLPEGSNISFTLLIVFQILFAVSTITIVLIFILNDIKFAFKTLLQDEIKNGSDHAADHP